MYITGSHLTLPSTWDLEAIRRDQLLVKLDSTKAEYMKVRGLFMKTCSGAKIQNMEVTVSETITKKYLFFQTRNCLQEK